MASVTMKLPQVIEADNYHDFADYLTIIDKFTSNKKVKYTKVGFDFNDNKYIAIFYVDKFPSKLYKKTYQMVKDSKK